MSERHEEEENEARGFKVVDRRRFTDDGDVREGASLADKQRPMPPATPKAKAPNAAAAPPAPSAPASATKKEADDGEEGGISFMQFIQSLAQQAMMQLGLMPHPATGQRELSPEGAQDTIEILSLLERKTKGNVTDEEAALLKQMVYELRMAYIEVTQAIAKQSMGAPQP